MSGVERLSTAGSAGPIETAVEDPGGQLKHFAVICHPHPLFGGTMENKVVTTMSRAFFAVSIPTVRFNFRGVGTSAGAFDHGVGETDDADRIADWGMKRWPDRRLVLAGFSFGAYVALKLADRRPTAHLTVIAPPVGRFDFSGLIAPDCPWLVVQGDADEVVDPNAVINWAESQGPQPRLSVIRGASHFFHGRLREIYDTVQDAIRSDL